LPFGGRPQIRFITPTTNTRRRLRMAKKTSFHIVYSDEDDCYVATVEKYPSLSWTSTDPIDALVSLIEVMKEGVFYNDEE
jgi:hypothetical protein